MLIEKLFANGVMTMGPSRTDPARTVGVFRPEVLSQLPPLRTSEMERFRWLAGEWTYENRVAATRYNPCYSDFGSAQFRLCDSGAWICAVTPDGRENRHITFDPFSRQWIYVLTQGSYGILRSPGWEENRIVFTGRMTMLGIDCEWRMSWTKHSPDSFQFVNEESDDEGSWEYIDEWHFTRK